MRISLILLSCLLIIPIFSIKLELEEGVEKCFSEELPKNYV